MRVSSLLALALLLTTGCRQVPASLATATPNDPVAAPATTPVEQPGRAPSGSESASAPTSIADFDTFMGLRRGDKLADMLAKFGEAPYQELGADSGLDTYYYGLVEDTDPDDGPPNAGDDYLFVVTVDRASGWVFNLEAMAGDYAAFQLDDPRLDLLGAPREQILTTFGEPTREDSGFHTYEHLVGEELIMDVEFVCYDHDELRCTEIWVTWYEDEPAP